MILGLFQSTVTFHLTMSESHKKNNVEEKNQLFPSWSFSKINYILFLFGLVFIFAGYIIMSTGKVDSFQSLTLAPILLFIGYIGFIPAALIYKERIFK